MLKKTIILILSILALSSCGWLIDKYQEKQDNTNSEIETKNGNIFAPWDYKYTIKQWNLERYYLLYVPKSYNWENTELILAFHGGMWTAEIMADNYGWIPKSDKEWFIVAFPNWASRFDSWKIGTWNAWNCCAYAVESKSNDVGFVKLIIDDIKSKANIDKIFATGMSNGWMFSHRLACEMSDTFTAIAAVAWTNNYDSCSPENPISVMHIHWKKDDHVLFDWWCGPKCVVDAETEFTSVADTIEDWVERNNCEDNPERVFENENGYCDLYSKCDDDVEVKLCVAKDWWHSWPGIGKSPKPDILETTTPSQAFSATDEIWDFFKTK